MPHGTVRSSIPRLRASKRGYGSIWTKVDPRTHLHLVHIVNFEWSVLLIGVFLGVDRVPLMEEWKDAGRALEIEIWIPFQKHDRDESPREPHLLLDTELKIVIKPTVRKVYFNSIIWTRLMRAANRRRPTLNSPSDAQNQHLQTWELSQYTAAAAATKTEKRRDRTTRADGSHQRKLNSLCNTIFKPRLPILVCFHTWFNPCCDWVAWAHVGVAGVAVQDGKKRSGQERQTRQRQEALWLWSGKNVLF